MTTHQSTTSSEDNAVCAHGIAASAISAWHDGELVPAEATRIAAHVANCPASRAHLDDYATLIAALRAQPVPYDAARLWADVRAGESQARGGPRRFRATGQRMLSPSNRYLAGLAAAAAAVLIVAGFATIFTHLPGRGPHQPRPTSTATQGPPRALQLTWTAVHLPVGVDSQHVFFSLAIAWNDGATAYACVAPRTFGGQPNPGVSGGATQFWRTQDRGATWTRLPDPPVDRQDITACSIAVDQIIPDQVLLSVTWQRNPTTLDESQAATYASADSGATWRRLPDPSTVEISTTATYQGTVYAERGSWGIYATKPAHPGLVASTDGMRTWHAVDGAITAAGESDNSYWLRPDTGELLAEASNVNFSGTNLPSSSTLPVEDLWDSTDDGVHWTKLAVPDLSHGNPTSSSLPVNFNVAQPVVGHPFAICANTYMYYGKPEQFGNLTCSDDGGKTWRERPMLFAAASELPGTPQSAGGPQRMEYLFAMTESGAVLGYTTYSNNLLYRLLPGRTEWQSLGTLPSLNFTPEYFPSPSGDVFWALPAVERPANFASSFSFYDSHDVVYIATYPPEA